jgi:proline dehydrogenase
VKWQVKMLNKIVSNTLPYLPKRFVWHFSKSYIAGETVADAIRVAGSLNRSGVRVTVDLLGEFIQDIKEADINKKAYLDLISQFEKSPVTGNYSLKPTMFGLLIDPERCYANIREIVNLAASHGNFTRIDMEDSRCVDLELELFSKLRKEFPDSVGLVVQAYLKRTPEDLEKMRRAGPTDTRLNFRLCKGIYVEPPEVAYQGMARINRAFLENLEFMFRNGMYVGIATHDRKLIKKAFRLIDQYGLKPDKYEFQMLHGVTPRLRQAILKKGHTMRVYVPYGEHWFGYSTRRLKENPAIASHLIRALLIKG